MKGLFYKEARCLWQYGKSYVLLVVIFFGLAFLGDGAGSINVMWLLYPVFFLGSLPASLLSADERDGWLVCCEALPVTRRQLVAVKYITCAALTAAVLVLALLAAAVSGQWSVLWDSGLLPLMPVAGAVAPALMLPAMFRFGATRGRAIYITVVILMAVSCAVLVAADGGPRQVETLLPLLMAAAAAIFAGSWVLSVRWFRRREL